MSAMGAAAQPGVSKKASTPRNTSAVARRSVLDQPPANQPIE